MKYDAIGIGNHDLDHGLPYLEAFAEHLPIPVVSTNLELNAPSAIRRSTIVSLPVTTSPDNKIRKLRIGILSVLPAQTEIWNHHVLDGKARIAQPSASLRAAVSRLRAKGAEMVVLLAHMGIDAFAHHHDIRENALNLAKIPGIDAIVAGHTHRRFPGTDHKARSGVDTVSGMLANRPAVMAGHKGSDLAVLDLRLSRQSTGDWKVARHQSSLRPNGLGNAPDPQIMTFCAVAHKVTRTRLAEPVGKSDVAMNNFFSLASPTLTSALVANAKARAAREALVGMPEARLPLLVTATAHTAGGRGGPDNYLNLPAGTILRRHLAGLCPYANTI
jgi:2',3'-cyclic-nucleotide 2'-phosphodiesterase/3'-nucleotidase